VTPRKQIQAVPLYARLDNDPRSGIVSIDQHTEIDEGKLMQFVFRAVGEVGAAPSGRSGNG